MGNKEAKFKKMYEEIDISGNGEVGFNELAAFIISDKVVEELKEFSDEDVSAIEKEFNEMDEADDDGKLTFEEFMEAMKKNKTISKLILKIADSNAMEKEMGNKEAKFKKMYKEIDISGNGEVDFKELAAFIISDKVVEELKEFSDEDFSAIEKELNEIDGKLTFEEFMEAMKKNKTISKLILKIADSNS